MVLGDYSSKKYRPSLKFAEISACELLGVFLGLGLLTGKDEKLVLFTNTERKTEYYLVLVMAFLAAENGKLASGMFDKGRDLQDHGKLPVFLIRFFFCR